MVSLHVVFMFLLNHFSFSRKSDNFIFSRYWSYYRIHAIFCQDDIWFEDVLHAGFSFFFCNFVAGSLLVSSTILFC
jgi:hypothetical protein